MVNLSSANNSPHHRRRPTIEASGRPGFCRCMSGAKQQLQLPCEACACLEGPFLTLADVVVGTGVQPAESYRLQACTSEAAQLRGAQHNVQFHSCRNTV